MNPKKMIPLARPDIGEEEVRVVTEVLRSGWLTQGAKVLDFEKQLCAYLQADSALCVSSCTTGLFLVWKALGIGPGDEVIVPSYSFIATANSVAHAGGTPVFADICKDNPNLDIESVRAALSPRTKAILLVHQIGIPADIDAFIKLAKEHNLFLVEDAACAIGSTYKGTPVGSKSDFAVFSFHPRKILTTGEGGGIFINSANSKYYDYIRMSRNHGMSLNDFERHQSQKVQIESYPIIGYNYRMTDLQGAIGLEQLKKLPNILATRRTIAERFIEALDNKFGITFFKDPNFGKTNFQSLMINISEKAKLSASDLMVALFNDGIATRRGIMCAHLEACYKGWPETRRVPLVNSERFAKENLVLPLFCEMSTQDFEAIVAAITKHLG